MLKHLNDDELQNVAGGKNMTGSELQGFTTRKAEFENAWDALKMEQKGYTGNMRAELFDEWEAAGYTPDAVAFLGRLK